MGAEWTLMYSCRRVFAPWQQPSFCLEFCDWRHSPYICCFQKLSEIEGSVYVFVCVYWGGRVMLAYLHSWWVWVLPPASNLRFRPSISHVILERWLQNPEFNSIFIFWAHKLRSTWKRPSISECPFLGVPHFYFFSALERKDFYSKSGKETSPRTLLCCLNQLWVLVGGHCSLLSGCPSPCILGSRHPTSCDGTCSCFQTMPFPLPRMPFMAPAQQEDWTLSVPILWMRKLRPRKGSILPESIQLLSSRARIWAGILMNLEPVLVPWTPEF